MCFRDEIERSRICISCGKPYYGSLGHRQCPREHNVLKAARLRAALATFREVNIAPACMNHGDLTDLDLCEVLRVFERAIQLEPFIQLEPAIILTMLQRTKVYKPRKGTGKIAVQEALTELGELCEGWHAEDSERTAFRISSNGEVRLLDATERRSENDNERPPAKPLPPKEERPGLAKTRPATKKKKPKKSSRKQRSSTS
jgi:hypothetical protein